MITVKAYLYPNTAEVQVFDPSIFSVRNRVVYSRPIKVYQGIDNPIQVILKNQDQKSVDISVANSDPVEPAYYVEASIQDPVNRRTIVKYDVDFADLTKGLGSFIIEKTVIDDLEQRIYKLAFSIENVDTGAKRPLYIDDNYGAPLDLEVLPGYYSATPASEPTVTEYTFDGGTIGS